MTARRLFSATFLLLSAALSGTALADTPDGFVKTGQTSLTGLLQQAASAQREAQMTAAIDRLVDYPELVHRCFRDDWAQLSAAQKTEVTELLHKLVDKDYRKTLKRTQGYTVTYTGTRPTGADTRVRTEAKSNTNPRDPAVSVDYVVAGATGGPYRVVDIITEGSSLTNVYYGDFHKMLTTAGQGYARIVTTLKSKLPPPPTAVNANAATVVNTNAATVVNATARAPSIKSE